LFAGVAGDLSPLTIEARDGHRAAPPALVVAMAVGLGSVDMPVPSVAEWEWLNWKFPRAVHAGDTIYARWTLTQKRPPVGGAASSIVVWRVDVHTADGALCAEGEVGAKVNRTAAMRQPAAAEQATPSSRRSRRGRRSRSNGGAAAALLPEPPPVAAPPAGSSKPERAGGPSRRRRRRRPSGSAAREEEHEPRAAHVPETPAAPPAPPPAPANDPATAPARTTTSSRRGIGGVIRRLRGPQKN
jgi:acyl dehydratase